MAALIVRKRPQVRAYLRLKNEDAHEYVPAGGRPAAREKNYAFPDARQCSNVAAMTSVTARRLVARKGPKYDLILVTFVHVARR